MRPMNCDWGWRERSHGVTRWIAMLPRIGDKNRAGQFMAREAKSEYAPRIRAATLGRQSLLAREHTHARP